MISIYCDGGCSGNQSKQNIGGWGTVLVYGEHIKELRGATKNTTNNKMELTALIEGLVAIKKPHYTVCVYSDSAYIINCFHQKWYIKWRQNNWRNSKKEPVENRLLWEKLLNLVENQPKVNFYKVKGHLDVTDDKAIQKWYHKFLNDYKVSMPYQDYLKAIHYNNRADQLASIAMDEIR